MMKHAIAIAAVAMLGAASAMTLTGTSALEVALQSGSRCGAKGNGALCSDGECCSKWGFCGKMPFHCDKDKGCVSQCKDSTSNDAQPKAVVPEAQQAQDAVQIVVKTISNAVPLCKNCPKPEPAPQAPVADQEPEAANTDDAADEPAADPAADAPAAADDAAAPEAAAANVATDGDATTGTTSQIAAIKQVQAEGAAKAKAIVDEAKAAAEELVTANKQAGVIVPTAGSDASLKTKGPLSEPVDVLARSGY